MDDSVNYMCCDNNLYDKLRHAAGFDASIMYPALFQLLEYRKFIAERLLSTDGDKIYDIKLLNEMYERINDDIKLIIGGF